MAERREYQQQIDTAVGKAGTDASADGMIIGTGIDGDASADGMSIGTGIDGDASADGMNIGTGIDDDAGKRARKMIRKLSWKTEWLVYNFYARCNTSMTRI